MKNTERQRSYKQFSIIGFKIDDIVTAIKGLLEGDEVELSLNIADLSY